MLFELNSNESGAVMQVHNNAGRPVAQMHADEKGDGMVWIRDDEGADAVCLFIDEESSGGLWRRGFSLDADGDRGEENQ
jgi:hypothetical protein